MTDNNTNPNQEGTPFIGQSIRAANDGKIEKLHEFSCALATLLFSNERERDNKQTTYTSTHNNDNSSNTNIFQI